MDIFDTIRVVFRWWFVSVPILLLSIGVAVLATSEIQPEYRAEGAVLMIGPAVEESRTEPGEFEPLNPLIDQPAALESVASVVALSLDGPQVAGILDEEGLSTDYAIGTERGVPVVLLEARAGSRAVALATVERLAELIDEEVQSRQADSGVPANQKVTTSTIQLASVGGADYGGRSRMRIVIGALGVGLAFGMAFLLEGLRRRRTHRLQDGTSDDPFGAVDQDAALGDDVEDPFSSAPESQAITRRSAATNAGRAPQEVVRPDREASSRGTRTLGRR